MNTFVTLVKTHSKIDLPGYTLNYGQAVTFVSSALLVEAAGTLGTICFHDRSSCLCTCVTSPSVNICVF